MKIYNSMTRKKEEFIPIDGNNVKMYACGITVYDLSHIGHARQAIVYSMIAEYLRYRGYNVKYVRNYTDVDDKIINKANMLGKNALEFSREQIIETELDMKNLHIKDADIKPKASENITNIINFVKGLIDKGYAYATKGGDVYFIVRKFKDYGKLSNRKIDELLNGVRKEVNEEKRDPLDFALWKSAKQGEIYWNSPWGNGRPGWHIECSAMVLNELGETIDIHGGGKDLIFPHHENEIAQSEAYTGKNMAKYWSHCGLIKINGEKMSKSLGNSLTIRDALKKYNYETIKYVFLQKHYTSDIDIKDEDFYMAEKHLYYFYTTLKNMDKFIYENNGDKNGETIEDDISENIINNFITVMDDDFNSVSAISELFGIFKYVNGLFKKVDKNNKYKIANTFAKIINNIKEVYSILGLFTQTPDDYIDSIKSRYLQELSIDIDYIQNQINLRAKAKLLREFNKADSIRDDLEHKGIILKDTKEGTIWDIKKLYNI